MIRSGEALRPIIEAGLGYTLPEAATFIGRLEGDTPVTVAAFSSWVGHDAEVSLWTAAPFTRGFLKTLGEYAFGVMGCKRITCRAAGDVPEWHSQLERMGFVREGCLRGGLDGEIDLVIFGIRKEEYRYGRWQ